MTAEANGLLQASPRADLTGSRVVWVDVAKGWCIILVVTMHSTLGVGLALGETGWLHTIVAFAKPFRMPDFFMVAGLFAASAVAKSWRTYLDRKVIHFAYFFVLWLGIILLVKARELQLTDPDRFLGQYVWAFVEPFSTMWFIHLLPIFFVVLRLIWNWTIWAGLVFAMTLHLAAAFHLVDDPYALASDWTPSSVVNNFSLFFIFFYIGAKAAGPILHLAAVASVSRVPAAIAISLWLALHAWFVYAGLSDIPGIGFILGLGGALAIATISAVLALYAPFQIFKTLGARSLVIYLSFVIPMVITRIGLVNSGLITNVDGASIAVIVSAIGIPLAFSTLIRKTPLAFLYLRPSWARLKR
ncbi:acyltransferase family protein [Roseiarcaceae bacterium H3SJ34-1]|uniref:acyltransferase family protein n=1 Tax=Terripilifer ovatus TaxID=3032367 RepID=UPI003AB97810|nr:acyltransferase family protein [Roseiarcaceae bacterium H3SJ34-1]